jgi:hypothetical protein
VSAEANLLESEEQTLEAAKALVRDGAAESCAEAFPDLTRHYGRLLRHLRHLIRVGDLMQEELNNLKRPLAAQRNQIPLVVRERQRRHFHCPTGWAVSGCQSGPWRGLLGIEPPLSFCRRIRKISGGRLSMRRNMNAYLGR